MPHDPAFRSLLEATLEPRQAFREDVPHPRVAEFGDPGDACCAVQDRGHEVCRDGGRRRVDGIHAVILQDRVAGLYGEWQPEDVIVREEEKVAETGEEQWARAHAPGVDPLG
jgi:hypothetical protein